jgi:transposase
LRRPEFLEDGENGLSGASRALFARLFEHFRVLDRQVVELEREINAWHREDERSQRLQAIPGIGPLTASALVASIGDAKLFHNGRQFAAWLGLVPRQNSSGGKTTLLGISKRGDTYLRTLLIHGARSVLFSLKRHLTKLKNGWGASWPAEIPILLRLLWLIKMLEPSGRCWRMGATFKPVTTQLPPRRHS